MRRNRTETWENQWHRWGRRWQEPGRRIARLTGWKVWNPGLYGSAWHARFRRCYPVGRRPLVCFGLNPGPYGMAQTGIPFTDIKRLHSTLPRMVSDLVRSGERILLPGLAPPSLAPYLTRTFESSSVRFYRFLELGWGGAEKGWRRVAVANPCPLLFIDPADGKNRTPADLGPNLGRRGVARDTARELMNGVDRLRVKCAREALWALNPGGVVLFGRNASAALFPSLAEVLGTEKVLSWEHPARAVPETWARGLVRAAKRRGFFLET